MIRKRGQLTHGRIDEQVPSGMRSKMEKILDILGSFCKGVSSHEQVWRSMADRKPANMTWSSDQGAPGWLLRKWHCST